MKRLPLQKMDLTALLFRATTLGALVLLSVPGKAEALGVRLGSDYVVTQGGTFFDFGGSVGTINFEGVPIDPSNLGSADTVIQRLMDVPLPTQGSSGMTDIEVVDLS